MVCGDGNHYFWYGIFTATVSIHIVSLTMKIVYSKTVEELNRVIRRQATTIQRQEKRIHLLEARFDDLRRKYYRLKYAQEPFLLPPVA